MRTKNRRREVRLSEADEDILVEAAGLAGVSVSEFLLDRALRDAERIVRTHYVIELDGDARRRFLDALDAPFERNEKLVAQVRKATRLKHVD